MAEPVLKKAVFLLSLSALIIAASCSVANQEPVELYPEDGCSLCRMAISDPRFAAEIISPEGEVFKFDDIGCLETFQRKHPEMGSGAVFVKDFESAEWLPAGKATIISTDVFTPMGSGRLAFSSLEASEQFVKARRDTGFGERTPADTE